MKEELADGSVGVGMTGVEQVEEEEEEMVAEEDLPRMSSM